MPIEYTVDQKAVHAIRDAMAAEADGKQLRRDLLRELREVGKPLVPDLQSAVRSIPAVTRAEPPLRDAVAQQVTVGARMSGRQTGLRIAVGTKKDPRGFRFAGRRLNSRKGWRHPVFGRDTYVQQYGREWFDPTVLKRRDDARAAVMAAIDAMARRIADRAQKESQ